MGWTKHLPSRVTRLTISVHFEIVMTKDQMKTTKEEGSVKKFKLTTTLSTAHMYLFDANGVIKKYDTPDQILKEFFHNRLQFYEKRRMAQLCELTKAAVLLKNKERYIRLVCDGTINLVKRKHGELFDELEKKHFKKERKVEDEVAAGEEKKQGDSSKRVFPKTGYDYLLSINHASFTYEKAHELLQERRAKEEEIRKLNNATSKSLWQSDLDALDYELKRDGYPSPESSPLKIAEETPKKKTPAKRAAASPLPQKAIKKRLKR